MLSPVLECEFLASMPFKTFTRLVIFLILIVLVVATLQLWESLDFSFFGFTSKCIVQLFMEKFDLERQPVITLFSLSVVQMLVDTGEQIFQSYI